MKTKNLTLVFVIVCAFCWLKKTQRIYRDYEDKDN